MAAADNVPDHFTQLGRFLSKMDFSNAPAHCWSSGFIDPPSSGLMAAVHHQHDMFSLA